MPTANSPWFAIFDPLRGTSLLFSSIFLHHCHTVVIPVLLCLLLPPIHPQSYEFVFIRMPFLFSTNSELTPYSMCGHSSCVLFACASLIMKLLDSIQRLTSVPGSGSCL